MVPFRIISVPEEISMGNPDPKNKTMAILACVFGLISIGIMITILGYKSLS